MTRKTVGIVDFGVGNLRSIERAVTMSGGQPVRSSEAVELSRCDCMVLPGVGAFPHGMTALRERGLVTVIEDAASGGKPILAICLGMQLLFEGSDEFGGADGLGVLRGRVSRLRESGGGLRGEEAVRLPNVGWSPVTQCDGGLAGKHAVFADIPDGTYFYFSHSYGVRASEESVVGVAPYGSDEFGAVVKAGGIVGFQGHPEKSGEAGLQVFRNFIR